MPSLGQVLQFFNSDILIFNISINQLYVTRGASLAPAPARAGFIDVFPSKSEKEIVQPGLHSSGQVDSPANLSQIYMSVCQCFLYHFLQRVRAEGAE